MRRQIRLVTRLGPIRAEQQGIRASLFRTNFLADFEEIALLSWWPRKRADQSLDARKPSVRQTMIKRANLLRILSMSMLNWIIRMTGSRRRRKEALDAARVHFQSRSREKVHRHMSSILHSDDNDFVIRICYGNTRPSSRAWFRISRDTRKIEELTFDDVLQYGEKPWR